MLPFSPRQSDLRDTTFPLRRPGGRFYTTDLRYMARRRRSRRRIALYEFAGIDHRERQLWQLRTRVRSWAELDAVIDRCRRAGPLSPVSPTRQVLERPEILAEVVG